MQSSPLSSQDAATDELAGLDLSIRSRRETLMDAAVALAEALVEKGNVLGSSGRSRDAMPLLDEATPILRAQVAGGRSAAGLSLARALDLMATMRRDAGQAHLALQCSEEAIAILRSRLVERPDLAGTFAIALGNMGIILQTLGRPLDAVEAYDEAAQSCRDAIAVAKQTWVLKTLANTLGNKVLALRELRDSSGALACSEEAIAVCRQPKEDGSDSLAEELAAALRNHALVLAGAGRTAEAVSCIDESIEVMTALVGGGREGLARDLGTALVFKGDIMRKAGRTEDSMRSYRDAMNVLKPLVARGDYGANQLLAAASGHMEGNIRTPGLGELLMRKIEESKRESER